MLGGQEVVSVLLAGRRDFLGPEEPGFVWGGLGGPGEANLRAAGWGAAGFKPCLEVCGARPEKVTDGIGGHKRYSLGEKMGPKLEYISYSTLYT